MIDLPPSLKHLLQSMPHHRAMKLLFVSSQKREARAMSGNWRSIPTSKHMSSGGMVRNTSGSLEIAI